MVEVVVRWCGCLQRVVCWVSLDALVGRPRLRFAGAGGAKVCGWIVDLGLSVESEGAMRSSVWLYVGVETAGGGSDGVGSCWYSGGHVSDRIELAI